MSITPALCQIMRLGTNFGPTSCVACSCCSHSAGSDMGECETIYKILTPSGVRISGDFQLTLYAARASLTRVPHRNSSRTRYCRYALLQRTS